MLAGKLLLTISQGFVEGLQRLKNLMARGNNCFNQFSTRKLREEEARFNGVMKEIA
jgi:hypothetical protein